MHAMQLNVLCFVCLAMGHWPLDIRSAAYTHSMPPPSILKLFAFRWVLIRFSCNCNLFSFRDPLSFLRANRSKIHLRRRRSPGTSKTLWHMSCLFVGAFVTLASSPGQPFLSHFSQLTVAFV